MRTKGREMHRDVRWPIEDGGRGRRRRVAERLELRGVLESSGGGTKAPRSRGASPQTGGLDRVQSSQQEWNPANWMTSGGRANGWSAPWEEGKDERKA